VREAARCESHLGEIRDKDEDFYFHHNIYHNELLRDASAVIIILLCSTKYEPYPTGGCGQELLGTASKFAFE
jgi:hypothetical protein